MFIEWIKKHKSLLISILVTGCCLFYCYGCEPKVRSLNSNYQLVTRSELQLELDNILATAQIRMLDLDKQEQLRSLILQNALIVVQGQPFNPLGILTGLAAVYGIAQGGQNVKQVVKNISTKRKVNNDTG